MRLNHILASVLIGGSAAHAGADVGGWTSLFLRVGTLPTQSIGGTILPWGSYWGSSISGQNASTIGTMKVSNGAKGCVIARMTTSVSTGIHPNNPNALTAGYALGEMHWTSGFSDVIFSPNGPDQNADGDSNPFTFLARLNFHCQIYGDIIETNNGHPTISADMTLTLINGSTQWQTTVAGSSASPPGFNVNETIWSPLLPLRADEATTVMVAGNGIVRNIGFGGFVPYVPNNYEANLHMFAGPKLLDGLARSDGPVFDLPEGYTVNSPSMGIVNNEWVGRKKGSNK